MTSQPVTRYELPPQGITLLGYIVRRMHKTALLLPVPPALAAEDYVTALGHVAHYAVAASVSYGPAYYQPNFNRAGERVSESDPATGALVSATLESVSPHYRISYEATLPGGAHFRGTETILGTTVGLQGLGMPAPSQFAYTYGDYAATLTGTLTSELALSIFRGTRIRAHGALTFQDNMGNKGSLSLDRRGRITMRINAEKPHTLNLPEIVN